MTHKIDSIESIGLQDSLLQILSSQQSPILIGEEKEVLMMYLELKRQNKDTSLLKNYLNLYHSLPHRSPELMERLVNMDSIELAGGGVIYITESIKGLAKRPYTLAALSLSQVITGIIQDESLFEPHRLSPNRTVLFSQDHNSKTTTECEKKQNPTSQ